MHGRKTFLPKKPQGYTRIHNNTYIDNPTIIYGQIQPQGKIAQWIYITTGK